MNATSVQKINDYDRLKTLYSISKLLSKFVSIEETFPQIFRSVNDSIPLLSAVIIEHWERVPNTIIWHSPDTTTDRIFKAVSNSKQFYIYIQRDILINPVDFLSEKFSMYEIKLQSYLTRPDTDSKRFITLPLIVDELSPYGVIQLESAADLNEQDLEFVDSLADLIGAALDRYYRVKRDRELRQKESVKSLINLYNSQDKIVDLESERDSRETFVSLLTHDLRTPLAAIQLAGQHILLKSENTEICTTSAIRILRNVDRLQKMVMNLLDAGSIRSGEILTIVREETNLSQQIRGVINELNITLDQRLIFINKVQINCSIDQNGIIRILENLCTNAVKYGREGSPVIVTLDKNESHFWISVKNEGVIISEEDQKTLFTQFKRSKNARLSTICGWGIGLTLVKGVAEAHGGAATVKSIEGFGTEFKVTIPFLKDIKEIMLH